MSRLIGVREVASSNLAVPTNEKGFPNFGKPFCLIGATESQ
jgi:hypothetical protein